MEEVIKTDWEVRMKRVEAREAKVEQTTEQLRKLLEDFFGDVVLVERSALMDIQADAQYALDYAETARDEVSQLTSLAEDAYRTADSAYDNAQSVLDALNELL
jgi:hypothetical protein